MIRSIDKGITALYQALVNASGKKPMWWGEQCAYLLLMGVGLGALRTDWPGPLWLRVVVLSGLALVAALMWFESRWAPGGGAQQGGQHVAMANGLAGPVLHGRVGALLRCATCECNVRELGLLQLPLFPHL